MTQKLWVTSSWAGERVAGEEALGGSSARSSFSQCVARVGESSRPRGVSETAFVENTERVERRSDGRSRRARPSRDSEVPPEKGLQSSGTFREPDDGPANDFDGPRICAQRA